MNNSKDKKTDDILEKLVHINRITKVVKGGRRFGFSALVVVGNQSGKIGIAHAKAKQVPDAIKKVSNSDRFRLCIFRSIKNISAQVIDDKNNKTLFSASSIEKDIKSLKKTNKIEISKIVAEKLAKKAQEKKISKIYFDRGIYKYHGRVKAFAETLRKNGMKV